MSDIGLTHIALPVSDVERSIKFYSTYARMEVLHSRIDAETGVAVVWICDRPWRKPYPAYREAQRSYRTRPFVIVLIQTDSVHPILSPFAHLGVGCKSREDMDALCERARQEGVLLGEQEDSGYPVGYWAFLRDPDGHTLELSYGQEIGLTVEKTF
ncbi:bleomycin resistance protein [Scytonema hofmannii PCC 7110]|uniref:Bleomycin resistance protein n=1 Tax=Scytonema hofmannii PCC 7110 TaxID=128403 RepID=A0A139X6Y5_9CYAN|nr:VOC family protein [Scytonema hofmannii]KYC40425.1 bleomycin resistance protein [Scytonema hofmannii PCC 7110]